ncbi:MAG TPA: PAS domain S-box protein, partial [Solirubrobacter sp.]|nr:PAS domain S-box protein [Solirubrobacter sp.]
MARPTILETLGRAFTGSRIGMALIDLDGCFVEVNPALCRMLGRPADELLGRSLDAVTHPEDLAAGRVRIAALAAGGTGDPTTYEKRYLRADGTTLWVRVTSSIALDDDGRPQAIFGQVEDITDRHLAEQQLRESREAFSRAFEDAPFGMTLNSVAPDEGAQVLRANAAMCELLHRAPEQLVGMRPEDLIHPDDLGRGVPEWLRLLAGERDSVTNEHRLRRADGESVWVSGTTSIVRADDGRPLYALTHVRDVTASREAERRLREAEQRFRSAFTHASVGMALLSIDGRVLRANAALTTMVGYPEEAMDLTAVVHPEDLEEGRRLAAQVLRGTASRYTHQPRMTRVDGTVLKTRVTGSVVRNAEGEPLHLVVQVEDITAARTAEETAQLRLAQQSAVAWLGQRALDEPDIDALLEAAVAVAAATLGVPIGSFLRVAADGDTVESAASIGWNTPRYTFSLRASRGVTAAVFSGSGPLVVEDVETETRFEAESLRRFGIASCVAAPVPGEDDAVYGALGVYSNDRRAFTTDDIAFVRSLANVITGAVRRDAAGRRLRHQSLHDPLTQLPNRTLLLDRLRHGIARSRRDGSTLAVLFC